MPVVPRYERRQMPSAVPLIRASELSLRTPPEAFGAVQGAELQEVAGKGLGALGAGAELMARMHVDRTLTEARTAMTAATKELEDQTRQLRELSARDAFDVVETGRKGSNAIRDAAVKGLSSPAARDLFLSRFEEVSNHHLGLLLEHQLAQTRIASQQSRADSSKNILSEAALFASHPERIEALRVQLQANTKAQLRDEGKPSPAEIKAATRETDSAIYGTVINSLLAADPGKAQDYFEEHKKGLTREAIQHFETKFAEIMPGWVGRTLGEKAFAKHGRNNVTKALEDLEHAGGTVEERGIAKQRFMQLVQQENTAKRLQDNETLEAFLRNSSNLDPKAQLALLASLPLDPDFRREAIQMVSQDLRAQTEQTRESRYLELYLEGLFNPRAFASRPLALEFLRVGDTRYSKLVSFQDSLRKGVQDVANTVAKDTMELWEKVAANKLSLHPSDSEVADYARRRQAALGVVLEGIRALYESGQLGDQAKISNLKLSALTVNSPEKVSLLPDAENPLEFTGVAKTAFESMGFRPRKWTFVQERNHLTTNDAEEIQVWTERYGTQLPGPYRGQKPLSLTIDRYGRPLWATFKGPSGLAEVWMTFGGVQFSQQGRPEAQADLWEGR